MATIAKRIVLGFTDFLYEQAEQPAQPPQPQQPEAEDQMVQRPPEQKKADPKQDQAKTPEVKIRLFCDMDGVLTDFDRGFKRLHANEHHLTPDEYEEKHGKHSIWPLIDKRGEKFWRRLPWKKDGRELWDYIERYDPIILSAPSRSKNSIAGKLDWIKLNLGINQKEPTRKADEVDADTRIIFSADKGQFVKGKTDILIDDKKSNIEKWTKAGGTGILHDDSTDTIKLLEQIVTNVTGKEEPNS